MASISAVLFDVDGVLLDSTESNIAFYRELFRRIGDTQPSEATLRSGMHLSVEAMLRQVLPHRTDADIYHWMIMADTIDLAFHLLKPMPGVLETVPLLASKYKLGLVTNRTVAGIEELWQVVPYRHLFQTFAAYEYTENHKPDPEPIHYVLTKLDVEPGKAVFIGDAKTDLQSGQAAGVPVIILGSNSWPGAATTVTTFSQIPEALRSIH